MHHWLIYKYKKYKNTNKYINTQILLTVSKMYCLSWLLFCRSPWSVVSFVSGFVSKTICKFEFVKFDFLWLNLCILYYIISIVSFVSGFVSKTIWKLNLYLWIWICAFYISCQSSSAKPSFKIYKKSAYNWSIYYLCFCFSIWSISLYPIL